MRRLLTACGVLAGALVVGACAQPDYPHEELVDPPSTITEPGGVLSVGESALLPNRDQQIIITVRAVEEGDAGFYDRFDNGEDFADYTPYFVVAQYDYPGGTVAVTPGLFVALSDGTVADQLVEDRLGGVDTCEPRLPGYDPEVAWRVVCFTALAPQGVTVSHIGYDGQDAVGIFRGEDGYAEDPVLWTVG